MDSNGEEKKSNHDKIRDTFSYKKERDIRTTIKWKKCV